MTHLQYFCPQILKRSLWVFLFRPFLGMKRISLTKVLTPSEKQKISRGQRAHVFAFLLIITRNNEINTYHYRRKELPIVLHPHKRTNLDPLGTSYRTYIAKRTDAGGRKRDEPDFRHPAIREGGSPMGTEEAPPKAGEGVCGIRTEEPPVLPLCGTTECAGRVGTEGGSRFPPTNASMVCQRLPQGRYTGIRPIVR